MRKIKKIYNAFIERHRYAVLCVMTSFASFLGFVNPVLSGVIAQNIIDNFNLRGIIPTFISMVAVKGTRMLLRSRVTTRLNGSMRAPMVYLQHHISKRLWWLEPTVDSWGWVGMVITKFSHGVPISTQAAAFAASMVTDTVNALLSGIIYYFTRSYILSLLTAMIIPALAVVPWFAVKSAKHWRFLRPHTR